MLIRNLTSKIDRAKKIKEQNENLRLAIANDANIASARKNAKMGVLPPPVEGQTMSSAELAQDDNSTRSRARDNLLGSFKPDQVRNIVSNLSINELKFLNIYWNDISQELKKTDTRLIDARFFTNILTRYIERTLSQKGLGERSAINEPTEMMEIIPSRSLVERVQKRVAPMNADIGQKLKDIAPLFPNEKIYDKLESLSEADQERIVDNLMKSYSNIAPLEDWNKILQMNDKNFLSNVRDLYQNFLPRQRKIVIVEFRKLVDEEPTKVEEPKVSMETQTETPKLARPVVKSPTIPKKEVEEPIEDISLALAPKRGRPTKSEAQAKASKATAEPAKSAEEPIPFSNTTKAVVNEAIKKFLDEKTSEEQKEILGKSSRTDILTGKIDNEPRVDILFRYRKEIGKNIDKDFFKPKGKVGRPSAEDIKKKEQGKNPIERKEKSTQGVAKFMSSLEGNGIKKGRGVRSVTTKVLDPISRWSQIGKLKYNNRLLDEKQMFSIKYPSGAVNPHFPKAIPVSDLFHELLTNLEKTKKVDKRILSDLDKDEKKLFEHFIVRSGAGRQFGIMDVTPTDEEKEREERYIIVKGHYLAGGNSPEIINELRSHILYFIDKGRISKSEGLATLRAIV